MRFLVDQPISWIVEQDLRSVGHDAIHVREINMASSSDEEIVAVALEQQRAVVTQDTDYGMIVMSSGLTQPSIVLFRMRDGRPSSQSAILLRHLPDPGEALASGAIVVVDDAAIRIRKLSQ